mgnify:CR=1 FL=1
MKHPYFDSLAYSGLQPFKDRWLEKIETHRSGNRLNDVFDEFVARYIVFEAAVSVLKSKDIKYKFNRDYCTNKASAFLSDKANLLVTELNDNACRLGDVIKEEHLSVVSFDGKDPELQNTWKTAKNSEKLKALLETLYYMRCNLFHGSKEFNHCQEPLLEAANACLKIITQALLEQLDAEFERRYMSGK